MAIESMTGFASLEAKNNDLQVSLEIKSVNSRFLDVNCKLPSSCSSLEPLFVKKIKDSITRGRVDLYLNLQSDAVKNFKLELNQEALAEYLEICEKVFAKDYAKNKAQVLLSALEKREILANVSQDEKIALDEEWFLSVLLQALNKLSETRRVEGAALEKIFLQLVSDLSLSHSKISEKVKGQSEQVKKRLEERLAKLLGETDLDQQRLAQEVAIIADKTDVSEELSRLAVHIEEFSANLAKASVGKKLEFLLQEMLREVNTVGSKCQDAEIAKEVVEAKSILEKMREQAANVA